MAKRVQIIGHDAAAAQAFLGKDREVTVDRSNKTVRVHDGVTVGGVESARADLNNVVTASASGHGKMSAAQASALVQALLDIIDNTTDISTNTAAILTKAALVSGATAGNVASLTALGDLADSGVVAAQLLVKNVAQILTGQINFGTATLTDGTNIAWNLNTQQVAEVELGGNRTLLNPTNMADGGTYILRVSQDIVGSRTLAYGSAYKWANGIVPVLSTTVGAIDIITFTSDGVSMFGVISQDFS